MTDAPPAQPAALAPDRRAQLDRERAAAEHLSRVNGELQLQAAVLALLLPPGSQRARRAWKLDSKGTPAALELLAHVEALSPGARLPWFEVLVSRMRNQSPAARQALLEATRRLMGARGVVRPLDRLHWLAMRQRLASSGGGAVGAAVVTDLSRLPQSDVLAISTYTAFLSRLVPVEAGAAAAPTETVEPVAATQAAVDAAASEPAPGVAWYDTVMATWRAHAPVEPCRPPDTDGLVHALDGLKALAGMHRPVLVRAWFTAAQQHSPHGRLEQCAADALRLSCALLASPLPPELARLYSVAAPEIAP